MSFTSKNLQSRKSGMGFIKGATLFFLGMSCVFFMARAFDVVPKMANSVEYLQQFFLTQNGFNDSPTTISLDGTNGNALFSGTVTTNEVCLGSDCRTIRPAGAIGGSATNIQFNAGGNFSGTNSLVRDSVNGRLGIGTASPTHTLYVEGDTKLNGNVELRGAHSIMNSYHTGTKLHTYYRENFGNITANYRDFLFDNNIDSDISLLKMEMKELGGTVEINRSQKDVDFIVYHTGSSTPTIFANGEDGNVGIGTSSPSEKLTVNGNVSFPAGAERLIYVDTNTLGGGDNLRIAAGTDSDGLGGGDTYIRGGGAYEFGNVILTEPGTDGGKVGIGTTTSPGQKLEVNGNMRFTSSGYIQAGGSYPNQLYLGTNGNVGIGTTSPTAKLDVNGNVGFGEQIRGSNIKLGFDLYGTDIGVYTDTDKTLANFYNGIYGYGGSYDNPRLSILDSNGNVGIGTTSPSYKLDVIGNSNFQNNVYASGNVGIGTSSPTEKFEIHSGSSNMKFRLSNAYSSIWMTNDSSIYSGVLITQTLGVGGIKNYDGDLRIATQNNTYQMVLKTGGNVGIGTNTPNATLHSSGAIPLQLSTQNADPDSADCQTNADLGRIIIQRSDIVCSFNPILRICTNVPSDTPNEIQWRGACLDVNL